LKSKKLINCIIVIVLVASIFNTFTCFSYAQNVDNDKIAITSDQLISVFSDVSIGKVTFNSVFSGIFSSIFALIAIILYVIVNIVMLVLNSYQGGGFFTATVENIIFNRIEFLSIDFFSSVPARFDAKNIIVENIRNWYATLRNIAIAVSLVILVYIAIRMAISTIGSDKSKYKKMFTYWVTSFVLIFLLQYIIVFAININNVCLDLISKTKDLFIESQIEKLKIEYNNITVTGDAINFKSASTVQASLDYLESIDTQSPFECIIMKRLINGIFSGASFGQNFTYVLVFCMLIYYIIKFFILYFKRMLTVAFLIVISPLITITYSIDKCGDGNAQAFNKWLKEFLINIFIQPIHCLLFLVFIFSTLFIAEKVPILAIIFFMTLSHGEKIVRRVIVPRLEGEMNSIKSTKIPFLNK